MVHSPRGRRRAPHPRRHPTRRDQRRPGDRTWALGGNDPPAHPGRRVATRAPSCAASCGRADEWTAGRDGRVPLGRVRRGDLARDGGRALGPRRDRHPAGRDHGAAATRAAIEPRHRPSFPHRPHRASGATSTGIAVTSATRTLLDLAGALPQRTLELAIEDAFRRGLSSPSRLERLFAEAGATVGPERPGSARCSNPGQDGRTPAAAAKSCSSDSYAVAVSLRPTRQHPVAHDGRTIHVDFAYPELRLAIEFDSLRWHTGRGKLDNDADRRNLLRAAKWDLVTVTYTMVKHRAAETASLICDAYARLFVRERPKCERIRTTSRMKAGERRVRCAGGCWRCRWSRRSTW